MGAPAAAPRLRDPLPPHDTLPIAAGIGALAVLSASLIISKYILELLVDQGWPTFIYVILVGVLGYGPSVWWWRYATRRWGTGRMLDDVGARPRFADLGWAPVIWLVALGVQAALASVVIALDLPFTSNTEELGDLAADRAYSVAIVAAAVVAAPIIEEVVFRGLLMRSLLAANPAVIAIALQGLLFGVAHIDPVRGTGNIGLAMVLSGVGTAFGAAAYLLRRIGPTVGAHAILNGVVMFILLSNVLDGVREDSPFQLNGSVQISVVDESDVAEPDGGGDSHLGG